MYCTESMEPLIPAMPGEMQAIIAIDWMRKVPNPEEWLAAIDDRLKPGGLLYMPQPPPGYFSMNEMTAEYDGWVRKWKPDEVIVVPPEETNERDGTSEDTEAAS